MTKKLKVLALAGSMRKGSYNKKLVKIAAAAARECGASVTLLDLNDYPLPVYQGDEEEADGLPQKAQELKKAFIEHEAFLFSCPEYNSSVAGTFKNAIDWVSRPEASDPYYLVAFKGKTAAIMSASPGELGGLRGLVHIRDILENIGVIVIPEQLAVKNAHEAFDDQGNLKNHDLQQRACDLAGKLVEVSSKLAAR